MFLLQHLQRPQSRLQRKLLLLELVLRILQEHLKTKTCEEVRGLVSVMKIKISTVAKNNFRFL
jgi:hypothetical protein